MSERAMPVSGAIEDTEKSSSPQSGAVVSKAVKSKKSAGAFRTISEVADGLAVQQHVLRFWETKFSQVRPLKRGGGRRYYRPGDVALLKKIHHLLYTEGYTIKGVQKLLREVGKAKILEGSINKSPSPLTATKARDIVSPQENKSQQQRPPVNQLGAAQKSVLESVLVELKELRSLVKAEG